MLNQVLIVLAECSREMAINIELAHDSAVGEHGDDDLRPGLNRAGQVSRIFADVIDYYSFSCGRCRPADSLIQWNAGMRRHCAFKWTENEHGEDESSM